MGWVSGFGLRQGVRIVYNGVRKGAGTKLKIDLLMDPAKVSY